LKEKIKKGKVKPFLNYFFSDCKWFRQENYIPGFKVTHLFGLDDKRNKEVAEKGKLKLSFQM